MLRVTSDHMLEVKPNLQVQMYRKFDLHNGGITDLCNYDYLL